MYLRPGGIGKLTDGILGDDSTSWLTWNKAPVSIRFRFDTSRQFNVIRIYSMHKRYRSVQIQFDDNQIIEHDMTPIQTPSSVALVDTILLNQYGAMTIGTRLEIRFEFDDGPLFLTEITFENHPAIVVGTKRVTSNTTYCSSG